MLPLGSCANYIISFVMAGHYRQTQNYRCLINGVREVCAPASLTLRFLLPHFFNLKTCHHSQREDKSK